MFFKTYLVMMLVWGLFLLVAFLIASAIVTTKLIWGIGRWAWRRAENWIIDKRVPRAI